MAMTFLQWVGSVFSESTDAALAPRFDRLEARMSEITAHLDSLETAVAGAEARTSNDLAALKQQIADLQAKVDAGTVTPDELARLDSLTARVAAIDPAPAPAPAPEPAPEPAPTPEPAPVDPNAPAPEPAPVDPTAPVADPNAPAPDATVPPQ